MYELSCCDPPDFLPRHLVSIPSFYTSATHVFGGVLYHGLVDDGSGGWIREDTITKKVFIISHATPSDTLERLLYDFNLGVGDTFKSEIGGIVYDQNRVIGLDSTIINGLWYKIWTFSAEYFGSIDYTVIEEIGCVNGLLYPINQYLSFEFSSQMICFKTHGLAYPLSNPVITGGLLGPLTFDNLTNCSPSLSQYELMPQNNFTIFPNPTESKITISSTEKINQVTITNLLSQTIFSHEYNAEKIQVDVATLPPGIYLIRINGTEVRQFVRQ